MSSHQSLLSSAEIIALNPADVFVPDRIGFYHEDKAIALGRLIAVDAGQQPNEIAADLKLPRRAVQNLVRSLNWSMAEDRLTAAALERGSTQLAAAVIAAGGHR